MTTNKFRKLLADFINAHIDEFGFVAYDNRDPDFPLKDDEISVVGEDDKEIFCFKIEKVSLFKMGLRRLLNQNETI